VRPIPALQNVTPIEYSYLYRGLVNGSDALFKCSAFSTPFALSRLAIEIAIIVLIALAIKVLLPKTGIEQLICKRKHSIDRRSGLSAAASTGTATAAVRQCFSQRLHHFPVISVDHSSYLN
jgi:hypothetical protein